MRLEMHTIFVYGSLRVGGLYHHLLDRSPLGSGRTLPRYTLLDLGEYPALVDGGDTSVVGELFTVTDAELARLDHLEGHPDDYVRTVIALADATRAACYLLPHDRAPAAPTIPGGDWIAHVLGSAPHKGGRT